DKVTAERDEELKVFLSEARLVKDAFEVRELPHPGSAAGAVLASRASGPNRTWRRCTAPAPHRPGTNGESRQ
ncbi:hypothetical protein ACWGUL_11785, partial [Streptomyces albidoflavus]